MCTVRNAESGVCVCGEWGVEEVEDGCKLWVRRYSKISFVQTSTYCALSWAHKINFLYLVIRACWSGARDLCKLSTTVFTQLAPSGFTPYWFFLLVWFWTLFLLFTLGHTP